MGNLGRFIKERVGSCVSKKVIAAGVGVVVVESWPQAAVVIAYIIGQAYVDSKK